MSHDYLDHTRSKPEKISVLDALSKGQLTFLYVTPERLQSTRFQTALSMCDLYMVVIDECHCITERDEAVDQPLYANKKNQHSWTTYAKKCEFSVYDKGYELKNSTELQYYRRFYA